MFNELAFYRLPRFTRLSKFTSLSGFTLLEILIALFVFTLISIILTTVLHTALNSQSATEKKSQQLSALETTMVLLSNDLEQTVN
ncbi:MAG: prepilin-type N-terminal cleavage/methylation domain-containing protein, partial [Gammaproteobacteria bacterium]|nr:prepilin-type N-terminal cleavage/methylation domain-containing protein [Gammaproteobacteria bacterium]